MSAAENNGKHNLRVERGGKRAPAAPEALEFEQAVLAAALMRTDVAKRLNTLVRSEDFDYTPHRFIFAAVCELAEQGKPADVLTVPQHLKQAEMLERCGGMAYFTALVDAIPTAAHVEYYAKKVREAGEKRALIAFTHTVLALDGEPLEIVAKAEEKLSEIRRLAMRGQAKQAPMTYAELMAADLPEPEYLIDKMIPQGCTLAHSVPKEGKTRLFTEAAIASTTGGKLFGKFEIRRTGWLCLFLEDNQPETQARLKALTEAGETPRDLHIAWDWETMDRGGLERLDQFLTEHPEVKGVLLDTLEYIRPPIQKDGQLYSQDVAALRKLKDLADKHHAYFIILHHSNKSKDHSDDVVLSAGGTNGIAGSCDTIMQLQGKPDGTKVFRGKGRRIPPFSHLVKMDERAGYQYLGEAETAQRTGEEQELLEALALSQWAMKEAELAQELGCKRDAVRSRCRRAADRKLVRRSGIAQWEITPEGRIALAEMNEGFITGDRPDQPDQAGHPDRDRIYEGEGAPLPEPPGQAGQDGYPGQGGHPGQAGQGGHLFAPPQSEPIFVEDLPLSTEVSADEQDRRQGTWRMAGIRGFPKGKVGGVYTSGGRDWWHEWCLNGSLEHLEAALRFLEGLG